VRLTGPFPVCRARTAAARFLVVAGAVWLAATGTAAAQITNLDALDAPIVRVNIRQGDVTIRTWDKPTVSVDGDPSLSVERRSTVQSGLPYSVPVAMAQGQSADGPVTLPAESFVVSSVPAGPREVVFVRNSPDSLPGGPPTPVTVTIPNNSVFVFAHTNNGTLDVRDYRGGTLFATAARGRVVLGGVGGAVFAQSPHGPVIVTDSTVDRIRARSLTGNLTFERCHARQVEATSVNGSVVYDNGSFEAGLARFESTRGDVAIGTSGGAQIGAHATDSGHVYTSFDHSAHVDAHGGDTNAVVGGGGPVVTANSQAGNVFLYDGALRSHPNLPPEWASPTSALQHPAERPPNTEGRTVAPQSDHARPTSQPHRGGRAFRRRG
jgi:hypothetical protein